jgi:DDE superfamily endonuclease
MLILPGPIAMVIGAFAPMCAQRIFEHMKPLVVGAILAPGKRTVTSVLRVMGRSHDQSFQNYHRVPNRAQWSTPRGGYILLPLLLRAFVPTGPVVIGVDETIERRRCPHPHPRPPPSRGRGAVRSCAHGSPPPVSPCGGRLAWRTSQCYSARENLSARR